MEHDNDSDKDNTKEQPPASWPSSGKIEFRNFSMKYHEDLEYALKNISLTISPGNKVGIVGRTGAGKTSLTRALFRLVSKKTCEGSILIDGHDIATVSTSNLRPRLGTILQESTIFEGSFKRNLDPLMEHTIEDMWAALIKCNMNEFVEPKRDRTKKREIIVYSDYEMAVKREIDIWNREWKESGWMKRIFLRVFVNKPELHESFDAEKTHGLDKDIDHISHLSNGQKQLFSLCRLLMRKYKIIVLDEATADVDLETDKEMQRLFRSKFKDCTVLTIAHRLETIMNSDKIIVMDKGKVVEFGPPKELIKQDGHFSELVKANDF
ncbi:Multidrug resistance-associated protein 1 [Coemansia sp. BCRC 34490]|nr:Multidrug resistance-associated protein 1 [Coemansia sp. BCRC 34490]